jgi:hypothetical protein
VFDLNIVITSESGADIPERCSVTERQLRNRRSGLTLRHISSKARDNSPGQLISLAQDDRRCSKESGKAGNSTGSSGF